jgi:hypothetical protein
MQCTSLNMFSTFWSSPETLAKRWVNEQNSFFGKLSQAMKLNVPWAINEVNKILPCASCSWWWCCWQQDVQEMQGHLGSTSPLVSQTVCDQRLRECPHEFITAYAARTHHAWYWVLSYPLFPDFTLCGITTFHVRRTNWWSPTSVMRQRFKGLQRLNCRRLRVKHLKLLYKQTLVDMWSC